MKVFLAMTDDNWESRPLAAFTRREDAESYGLAGDVEEIELHDGPVEVRTWNQLFWWPSEPDHPATEGQVSNPYEAREQRDFDGQPERVAHDWKPPHRGQGEGTLVVEGWDLARVRKVYSEQRALHLARPEEIRP